MADVQILRAPSSAVPSNYTLPDAAELRLKAVYAEFDGSGAAGNWLPCVTILSDSGDVIARAVDQGVVVTAGADADVAWFPGVKRSGAAATAAIDAFAPQQFADMGGYDFAGSDWVGFAAPTIDAACMYNGYLGSSGTQGDFFDMRFSLGPKGSLWLFDFLLLKGPNYGELFGYLGTPHESAPASGEPDPTNLLTSIDGSDGDFTYRLAFKISCYAAVLTRNVQVSVGAADTGVNPYGATTLRIGGDVGDTLTTFATPGGSAFTTGDGGPGVYALKIEAGGKVGPSTGYKLGIQAITAHRVDWKWA